MRKFFLSLTMCFALLASAIAQKTVTGTVTDDAGVGLPGVAVTEKGTTNGTITNADGDYTIGVSSDDAVLNFSFVGMATVEESVSGLSIVDVTMEPSTVGLDEVVVTALGIKKEAKALGYAVSRVDSERIMASGSPSNALKSLYGSAAGVQVQSTATGAAGGMKINIRNAVSFDASSSTRPLIVVDGVPIHDENSSMTFNARAGRDNGTGINDINPDDIASFEILKGAKASVLYGSEGANGVVLITTKTGQASKGLGVSASYTSSVDRVAFMPELQNQYGTGRSPSNSETDDQGYMLDIDGNRMLDYSGGAFGPKFDPNVQLKWWDDSTRPWVAQDETIFEQLFRQGSNNTANISLTAGDENGSARFSYTNMQIDATTPNSSVSKNTFSFSANYKLNDYVTVKYVGNYYVNENLNAPYSGSFDGQGARASLGAYSADIDVNLLNDYLVTDAGYNWFANPNRQLFVSNGRSSVISSLWDWNQNESNFNRYHNIQSMTVDIRFNDTFGATILGGLDNTNERTEYKGRQQDPSQIGAGVYRDVTRVIRKSYGQGLLTFDTDFSDFNFSGFVGGVIRHNFTETKGAQRLGDFVIPNFFSFTNLPSGENPNYVRGRGEDILYSVIGSAQLEWNDQIYLEAQGRNDWSSILPPQNNSYFYPGLSATWIASNSLELPAVFNFLKLRTSWADVGRPGPRYFSNVNLGVSQSGSGFIVSPPGSLPPMDDNFVPNLQPERKREYEVGLESYLFRNQRLGVDFSLYTSNTYNQIMAVTAPPGLGVSSIRMNAGNIANTGWELTLKTKPIFNTDLDLQWNVDFTFANSKTKVLELDGELSALTLWSTNGLNAVAEVGGEYGLIYQTRGWQHYINPSDANDPNNGRRIVKNDGTMYNYSATSTKMVGKLIPDVTGGMFTSVVFKNFKLFVNLDYSFGAFFMNESETYMMAAGVLEESLEYRDQETGGIAYHLDEGGQKVAGANPGGGATYYDGVLLDGVFANGNENDQVVAAEDYYYQSYFSNGFYPEDRIFTGDYIALRNLALDYTIPFSISNRIGLNRLTLSAFVNNVAYLYKAAPNTTPESSEGTAWTDAYRGGTALPGIRSMGFAVKIGI